MGAHHRTSGHAGIRLSAAVLCLLSGVVWGPLAAQVVPTVDAHVLARQHASALAAVAAGSTAASAAVLRPDTLLYTTSFRRADWSGTVTATRLNGNGQPGATVWDAEASLARRSPSSRTIYTQTTDGLAVELQHHLLDAAQQVALGVNPPGAAPTTATAEDRVAWLRGGDVQGLRPRMSRTAPFAARRLADMVGAELSFVPGRGRAGPVRRQHPDMVVVGSNGGMLHAFHAGTAGGVAGRRGGDELFAYVPSELLSPGSGGAHAPINELMRPDYTHRLYVAGAVDVADADWDGRWRTVLAGAMGAGGRTVFALDVTDPAGFQASSVLWEFRYSDEACQADPAGLSGSTACRDMGYGITKPKVVRLPGGRWAVVFGNGYHGGEHRAKLFIVDLRSGRLLYLVDTGVGSAQVPNGMGPVAVTDWPANDLVLNRMYAGDELGDLWRIVVPSNGAEPRAERLLSATDAQGVSQPITAEPALAAKPGSGSEIVVVFGTGSLLDAQGQVQTLYGIFDHHKAPATDVSRGQLREQAISANTSPQAIDGVVWPAGSLRQVTDHDVQAPDKGWRLDLPVAGERVLGKPTFPSGAWQERVRFFTQVPASRPGHDVPEGFVMDIDLLSGGRGEKPAFALQGGQALVLTTAGVVPVSGVGGAWARMPVAIRAVGAGVDHLVDANGGKLIEGRNTAGPAGRQSWRQLR